MDPVAVSDVHLAFPADVSELMPEDLAEFAAQPEAPDWRRLARHWWMGSAHQLRLWAYEGIDAETAYRHICAILGSFQPKHEDKIEAVAYLAWSWFGAVRYDRTDSRGVEPQELRGPGVTDELVEVGQQPAIEAVRDHLREQGFDVEIAGQPEAS